jgi:hypothetical protein
MPIVPSRFSPEATLRLARLARVIVWTSCTICAGAWIALLVVLLSRRDWLHAFTLLLFAAALGFRKRTRFSGLAYVPAMTLFALLGVWLVTPLRAVTLPAVYPIAFGIVVLGGSALGAWLMRKLVRFSGIAPPGPGLRVVGRVPR